jgi:hypothetical protein
MYEARNIKYYECVYVFLPSLSSIQITPLQGTIILSSVACLAVPHFPTLSPKRLNFRRKLLNTKCVFWFSLQISSETFLILRRNEWDESKVTSSEARLWPRGRGAGRSIALLFQDLGCWKGVSGQRHAPAALYPREKLGTHCTEGWVGPRACLDGQKISPHRDSIPGLSRP